MKKIKVLFLACVMALPLTGCFEDLDDNLIAVSDIQDFVWKGMNAIYVYKSEIPDLANDRFSTNEEYASYLSGFDTPEALFSSLIYLPDDIDEFSIIVPNYLDLEQQLQGTSLSNGMAFGLRSVPNDNEAVFGYVRYIMPNTSAETQGLTRGIIFNGVNGTPLTRSNFGTLLFGENTTYSIDLANYDDNGTPNDTNDDIITPIDQSVSLTKSPYTENPILFHDVLNIDGNNIGYLMYNGFRFGDSNLIELNNVFGEFQAENVTDLVLDLRYNGGGTVNTAIWLASMITGQNNGDVFFEEKWNDEIQASLEENSPESLVNPFVNQMIKRDSNGNITFQQNINSLNLNRVYMLTTGSTASASELVINGLRPYINVIQIGVPTRGKPQASTTIYDSENFSRENVNPNHYYALQPLIYESENADGFSEYYDGLEPTTGLELAENYGNLGELGNANEPLLEAAISQITGLGRSFSPAIGTRALKDIADDKFNNPFSNEMVDNRRLEHK